MRGVGLPLVVISNNKKKECGICSTVKKKRRNRRAPEHTQRANMTQEILAKAQTGWDIERDRDKSL